MIEINVDDSQLEDALDDALQIFAEYHFDGVEKVFYKYAVTASDITNGFIDVTSAQLDRMTLRAPGQVLFLFTNFSVCLKIRSNMFSVNYQYMNMYGLLCAGQHVKHATHKVTSKCWVTCCLPKRQYDSAE